MSKGTKNQFYRYSMRCVLANEPLVCKDVIMLEVIPPDNALSIENMFVHIRFRFESSVPSGSRVIQRVGILSDWLPRATFQSVSWQRYLQVDKVADADRYVDFNVDLSSLLNRENIGLVADGNDNATVIYVQLPGDLIDNADNGTFHIWKADAIYTTTEIR